MTCTTYRVVNLTISAYSTNIITHLKNSHPQVHPWMQHSHTHCLQIWFTSLAVSCNYSYYSFRVQITELRGIKTQLVMHPKCQSKNKGITGPLQISQYQHLNLRGKAPANQINIFKKWQTHHFFHANFQTPTKSLSMFDKWFDARCKCCQQKNIYGQCAEPYCQWAFTWQCQEFCLFRLALRGLPRAQWLGRGATHPDKVLFFPSRIYLGGEDKGDSVGILCDIGQPRAEW